MAWLRNLGRTSSCVRRGRITTDISCDSVLCGDYGIKQIDEPFIRDTDDKEEWAI